MPSITKRQIIKFQIQCFKSPWLTYDMCIEKYIFSDNSVHIAQCDGCEFFNNSPECKKCCSIVTRMFQDGYSPGESKLVTLDHLLSIQDNE